MTLRYDGLTAEELSRRLGLRRVVLLEAADSTMDAAHALAAEAAGRVPGTLVLTDRQQRGRGRQGRAWFSRPGESVTMTLLAAPTDPESMRVLSLRVGLEVAHALEPLAREPVWLKWPNDLMRSSVGPKVGGILVETRWRGDAAEWAAIGVGLNLADPGIALGGAFEAVTDRLAVLAALVGAVERAALAKGPLSTDELRAYHVRDWLRGRRLIGPVRGTVEGIDATGALIVMGPVKNATVTAGSPVLEEDSYAAGV